MNIMCQEFFKLLRAFLDCEDLPPALKRRYHFLGCYCKNVRNKHLSSFLSGSGVLVGMHLKDAVLQYFCATDVLCIFD